MQDRGNGVIVVSPQLGWYQSLDLAAAILTSADQHGSVELSFADNTHVDPFSIVLLALTAEHVRNSGGEMRIVPGDNSYVEHMGLFSYIDPHQRPPASARREGERYVALTTLLFPELEQERRSLGKDMHAVFQQRASQLADILTQGEGETELRSTLAYALFEIMRNAWEHAETDRLLVCAQYWPSRDAVSLAVGDSGIGIAASLSGNPHIKIHDDLNALELAILPGISGKEYTGAQGSMYGAAEPNRNSGWGLFLATRLCQESQGEFAFASGTALLRYKKKNRMTLGTTCKGTLLQLTMHPSNLGSLRHSIDDIAGEAKDFAASLKGAVITPSDASRGRWLFQV
jgi:hypothetical protein